MCHFQIYIFRNIYKSEQIFVEKCLLLISNQEERQLTYRDQKLFACHFTIYMTRHTHANRLRYISTYC